MFASHLVGELKVQRRGLLWLQATILQYCTTAASAKVKNDVEDFLLDNDLTAYFLGICQDFKHFGFSVSVLILNEDGTRIVRLLRKEACYCRFSPADAHGRISKILYANWRKAISSRSDIEEIDLLDLELSRSLTPRLVSIRR